MSPDQFMASLSEPSAPAALSQPLRALWLDAQGEFDAAHEIAQRLPDPEGARIHAYLHRKEGDESNARYWYGRAGASFPRESLEGEWHALVQLLAKAG